MKRTQEPGRHIQVLIEPLLRPYCQFCPYSIHRSMSPSRAHHQWSGEVPSSNGRGKVKICLHDLQKSILNPSISFHDHCPHPGPSHCHLSTGCHTAFQLPPCLPWPLQSVFHEKPACSVYRVDQLMLNAPMVSQCIQDKSKFPLLTSRAPTASLALGYF